MAGDESRRDRFRGTLLGVAIGDGLGASFEGASGPVTLDEIAAAERSTSTLRYTDDTAMTIALAESLLEVCRLDQDHLATTFARHWAQEPWRGYGGGVASLLECVARGADWRPLAEGQFGGQGSFGNGAAMRVAPVALHPDHHEPLEDAARASASVTHTHPLALDAAAIQVRALTELLALPGSAVVRPGDISASLRPLAREPEMSAQLERAADLAGSGDTRRIAREIGTGISASEAMPAALCAFLVHPDSFADAVRFAIGLGGDTDTIAAMTGALAGARHGEGGIPSSWVERIEAADVLRSLADRFAGF